MKIFLDANAVIYLVEGVKPWYGYVRDVLAEQLQLHGRMEIAVSALSWLECRVKPLREENQTLLEHYQAFVTRPRLHIQPIETQVLDRATWLRAYHRLKTPDAIQAASALLLEGEVLFVTGEARFEKVPGLKVVRL